MSPEGSLCELQATLIRLISMEAINWTRILGALLIANGILHYATWDTMVVLEDKLTQIQEVADFNYGYVYIEPSPNGSQEK